MNNTLNLDNPLPPKPLGAIAAALLVMAGLWAALVLATDAVSDLDLAFNEWLSWARTDSVLTIAHWITDLGGMPALTAVAITVSVTFGSTGQNRPLQAFWIMIAGSQITIWCAKYAFSRPRPEYLTDAVAFSPSFPSAHAGSSLVIYGGLALLLAQRINQRAAARALVWGLGLVAVLIGLSRPLLSVHFVSDVIMGWLVGAAWVLLGLAWLRRA